MEKLSVKALPELPANDSHYYKTLLVAAAIGFLIGVIKYPVWPALIYFAKEINGSYGFQLIDGQPVMALHVFLRSATWCSFPVFIAALLLQAGCQVWTVSLLVSGSLSALSFAAVCSLALLYGGGRKLFALTVPLLLLFYDFSPTGHQYTIAYPNYLNALFQFGLYAGVLCIALISARRFGAGFLLLGLMPGIHGSAALVTWLYAAGVLTVFYREGGLSPGELPFRRFAVGCLCSGVLVAYFVFKVDTLDLSGFDHERAQEMVLRVIDNGWNYHLTPILSQTPVFRHIAWFLCVDVLIFGIVLLLIKSGRWNELPSGTRANLAGLAVTLGCIILYKVFEECFYSHLPFFLVILMPNKWLNIGSLMAPVIVLGLCFSFSQRNRLFAGLTLCVLFAFPLIGALVWEKPRWHILKGVEGEGALSVVATVSVVLLIALSVSSQRLDAERSVLSRLSRGLLLVPFVLTVGVLLQDLSNPYTARRLGARYYFDGNTALVENLNERQDTLLLGPGVRTARFRPYLLLNRPIISGGGSSSQYRPVSLLLFERVNRGVYGLSLELEKSVAREELLARVSALWLSRTRREWIELAREFGFSEILVRSEHPLPLPLIYQNRAHKVYRVDDSLAD